MQEPTLTKFCLAIAIIGIIILYFISQSTQPPSLLIKDIDNSWLDKDITTTGTIKRIESTPGLYIVTLEQNSRSITVVVFKEEGGCLKDLNPKKEISRMEVTGKVA